jgi:hypothetical protein
MRECPLSAGEAADLAAAVVVFRRQDEIGEAPETRSRYIRNGTGINAAFTRIVCALDRHVDKRDRPAS